MSKTLVVKAKNDAEMEFLSNLLGKLGMRSTLINEELIEDLGLSLLLKDVDKNKKVSRETILKKLRS